MVKGVDRASLGRIAARAGAGLLAGLRASGCGGHRPLAIIMVKGIDRASLGRIAARTGAGLLAGFHAGGCRGHRPLAIIMANGIDRAGLGRIAAGADAGLLAGFRAGRRGGHRPLAIIMVEGIGIYVNIAFPAARAGMGGIALLGTGRIGDYRCVVMTKGRGVFRVCAVATRAGVGVDACFSAGGAVNGRVVMAEGVHRTGLDRITTGAGAGLLPYLRAGGLDGHFPLTKAMVKGGDDKFAFTEFSGALLVGEIRSAPRAIPILRVTLRGAGGRNSFVMGQVVFTSSGNDQTVLRDLILPVCIGEILFANRAVPVFDIAGSAACRRSSRNVGHVMAAYTFAIAALIATVRGPFVRRLLGSRLLGHGVRFEGGGNGNVAGGHDERIVRDLHYLIICILHHDGDPIAFRRSDHQGDFLTCCRFILICGNDAGYTIINTNSILSVLVFREREGGRRQREQHGQCHNQCNKPFSAHLVLPSASKSYLPTFGIYSLPACIRHPMQISLCLVKCHSSVQYIKSAGYTTL